MFKFDSDTETEYLNAVTCIRGIGDLLMEVSAHEDLVLTDDTMFFLGYFLKEVSTHELNFDPAGAEKN